MQTTNVTFESALKKAGLKTTPDDIYSPKGQEIRKGAVALTGKRMQLAIDGRLGLVIDGTGKNYEKISGQARDLKALGYETAMIFVNTTEEDALFRNRKRARKLPDAEVSKMWRDVQKNIGKFQNLFRRNMFVVDNSEGANWKGATLKVYKQIASWSRSKPKGGIAKKWMDSQRNKG